MDKCREQFEEWAKSHGMSVRKTPKYPEDYFYRSVHSCWVGWRASRQALVVQLPKLLPDCEVDAIGYVETVRAIKSAGVKYK